MKVFFLIKYIAHIKYMHSSSGSTYLSFRFFIFLFEFIICKCLHIERVLHDVYVVLYTKDITWEMHDVEGERGRCIIYIRFLLRLWASLIPSGVAPVSFRIGNVIEGDVWVRGSLSARRASPNANKL